MKKSLRCLILIICALAPVFASFAGELPRIAVYVSGDVPNNEKEALGTIMLAALVNSGRYMGIERSESFLAKLDEEHVKQRSGAIDDGQISELGRQFGVRHICIAAITPALGAFQVSARIIDVETAAVAFIGEANSPLRTIDDLTRVADEVVAVMFGEAPARPRFDAPRQKIGISAGAGGVFSNDFGGGMDRSAALPYSLFGAYLFVDAGYAQVTLAYSGGKGVREVDNDDPNVNITRSAFTVGIYAKYPKLPLGTSGKIELFPLVGIDYEVCLSAESDLEVDIYAPKDASEFNALWGKLGAGVDYNFKESVYLRVEMMYGARMPTEYEKKHKDDKTRLGHGLTAKFGSGIRF